MRVPAPARPLLACGLLLAVVCSPLAGSAAVLASDAYAPPAMNEFDDVRPVTVSLRMAPAGGLLVSTWVRSASKAASSGVAQPAASPTNAAPDSAVTSSAQRHLGTGVLPPSAAQSHAGAAAKQALSFALEQLGKPYVWGAAGPDTFDCSGLTMRAYQSAGYELPRVAADQALVGVAVDVDRLLPGDLLFYATNPADLSTIHHVVMYAGDGLVVHAPTTGDVVRLAPMWMDQEYAGAVRIVPAEDGSDPAPTELPTGLAAAAKLAPTPTTPPDPVGLPPQPPASTATRPAATDPVAPPAPAPRPPRPAPQPVPAPRPTPVPQPSSPAPASPSETPSPAPTTPPGPGAPPTSAAATDAPAG